MWAFKRTSFGIDMDDTLKIIKNLFRTCLNMDEKADNLDINSPILGAIPEFDSITVVSLIIAIEERFQIKISDEEINDDIFETIESLIVFISNKQK
mgnify:FL=1|tara:strand:+ start:64283 stop:64570 length:288 start_codon:yes stop_codon:yes gene_type:complete